MLGAGKEKLTEEAGPEYVYVYLPVIVDRVIAKVPTAKEFMIPKRVVMKFIAV